MSRFRPEVEAALREAGWYPGRSLGEPALAAIRRSIAGDRVEFGMRLGSFADADRALDEFGGLTIGRGAAGVEVATRPFILDPTLAAHRVRTLMDLHRAVGLPFYPLGIDGDGDLLLAINSLGQVLGIDSTGEWFLGDTIDQAIDTLVTGRRPPRVGDDGRWPGRVWQSRGEDPHPRWSIGADRYPICAAFFLPATPFNVCTVWLPQTLGRMGVTPHQPDPGARRLSLEWGEAGCEVHVLDLEDYTVLLLAFEEAWFEDQQAAAKEHADPRLAEPLTTTTEELVLNAFPLARAFRDACAALQPDLRVAFLQGTSLPDLDRWVARHEDAVLTFDTVGLLDEGLALLYLGDGYVDFLPPALPGQDELTVPGGRIFFRGSGADRW